MNRTDRIARVRLHLADLIEATGERRNAARQYLKTAKVMLRSGRLASVGRWIGAALATGTLTSEEYNTLNNCLMDLDAVT